MTKPPGRRPRVALKAPVGEVLDDMYAGCRCPIHKITGDAYRQYGSRENQLAERCEALMERRTDW